MVSLIHTMAIFWQINTIKRLDANINEAIGQLKENDYTKAKKLLTSLLTNIQVIDINHLNIFILPNKA
ncbi:MAG TPA: hypothetical protein VFX43_14345 [Chitinophagaceae bacterium]|nr:hypothetical protein [Chitinophagaceae bacterium]